MDLSRFIAGLSRFIAGLSKFIAGLSRFIAGLSRFIAGLSRFIAGACRNNLCHPILLSKNEFEIETKSVTFDYGHVILFSDSILLKLRRLRSDLFGKDKILIKL